AAWREFGANTQGMLSFTPKNALGLDYALSFTTVPPPEGLGSNEVEHHRIVQSYRKRTLEARAAWRIVGLGLFAALFAIAAWRGARRERDGSLRLTAWEAASLGAAAIPFLTMPGSYYIGFVCVGGLLAARRVRVRRAAPLPRRLRRARSRLRVVVVGAPRVLALAACRARLGARRRADRTL